MLKKTLKKKLDSNTLSKRNFSYFTISKAYFLMSDLKQELFLYTYLDILDRKGKICQNRFGLDSPWVFIMFKNNGQIK